MTTTIQPALMRGGPARPALTLFPYQRTAVDAILGAWQGGMRRPAISAATGSGKSIMLAKAVEESGERALIIAHRKEIIDQLAERVGYIIDPADVGIVMADRNQPHHPVVVASIQTLASRRRLAQLGQFGLVVVDEAHHSVSPSYRTVLNRLGATDAGGTKALGVSATWDREDGKGFEKIFDEIVFTIGIEELIATGNLCDIQALQIETQLDVTGIPGNGAGDFNAEALSRRVVESDYADTLAHAVKTHASDRKSLVFAPNVRTAEVFAETLRDVGINARMVSGTTPATERQGIVTDLRAGRLQAVVNVGVFTEGTDLPIVDCIVMGRPTKSRALYSQMAGRGLRKHLQKKNCLILDLVGNAGRLKLQTAASLIGREDAPKNVASFRELIARPAPAGDVEAKGALGERFVQAATTVELLDREKMAWIQLDHDAFSLSAGQQGNLIIQGADDGTFNVTRYGRERGDREELGRGLDIGYAQGVAEAFVAEHDLGTLADPNARWRRRKEPATPNQLTALQRWRIPHDESITKAEASDLLSQAIARAELRRGA